MVIHPLFHWAPVTRRSSIASEGLRIKQEPTCDSIPWDRVCASLSPSHAWAHSAGMVGRVRSRWDLWQIQLAVEDQVQVQPFYGNVIGEIRIHNDIPPMRLWMVGSRVVEARDD